MVLHPPRINKIVKVVIVLFALAEVIGCSAWAKIVGQYGYFEGNRSRFYIVERRLNSIDGGIRDTAFQENSRGRHSHAALLAGGAGF